MIELHVHVKGELHVCARIVSIEGVFVIHKREPAEKYRVANLCTGGECSKEGNKIGSLYTPFIEDHCKDTQKFFITSWTNRFVNVSRQ